MKESKRNRGPKVDVWNLEAEGIDITWPDDPDRWGATCECGAFIYTPTKREAQEWAKQHRAECKG